MSGKGTRPLHMILQIVTCWGEPAKVCAGPAVQPWFRPPSIPRHTAESAWRNEHLEMCAESQCVYSTGGPQGCLYPQGTPL